MNYPKKKTQNGQEVQMNMIKNCTSGSFTNYLTISVKSSTYMQMSRELKLRMAGKASLLMFGAGDHHLETLLGRQENRQH